MCAFCSSFIGLLCLTLLELCIKSIKLHVTKQINKNSYKDLSTIYNLLKCLFQSSSGSVCISLYIHYFSITWSLCVCMCVCMHAHDCGDICTYTYRGACICFFLCGWQRNPWCHSSEKSVLCFETVFLMDLILTDKGRVACQETWWLFLCLLPQCWNYKCAHFTMLRDLCKYCISHSGPHAGMATELSL